MERVDVELQSDRNKVAHSIIDYLHRNYGDDRLPDDGHIDWQLIEWLVAMGYEEHNAG